MIYYIVGGDVITPKMHTRQFLINAKDFHMSIEEVMRRVNAFDDMQIELRDCKFKLNQLQSESKPEFTKGQKVLVGNHRDTLHFKRYFSHIDDSGMYRCFKNGSNEWSSDGCTTPWNYCKAWDENNES